jgi:anti-sigma-K factor RskA
MPTSEPHGGATSDDGGDEDFRREIDLLRSIAREPVELVDAPPEVWDRVSSAAHIDDTTEAAVIDLPARSEKADPETDPRPTTDEAVEPTVLERRRARRRRGVLAAAAAVVVLVVGVGVVVANQPTDDVTSVATAELVPYRGAQVGEAAGRVELLSEDDQQRLRVDMHDLPTPAPGTFYELWLIDPSSGRPVSVATMKDGSSEVNTDIDLPPGTDTGRYNVVDVSVQQDAAGPEHSGDSVLRGTLAA